MDIKALASGFRGVVEKSLDEDSLPWFLSAIFKITDEFDHNLFAADFSVVARKLGKGQVKIEQSDRQVFKDACAPYAPENWEIGQAARAAMITKVFLFLPALDQEKFLYELYYRGDNQEKQAVLQTLIFLPDSKRFLHLAVEGGRTNVMDVFYAIACDNAFAWAHFTDLQFNQMVLKALFTGTPIERILGWKKRNNSELLRMANDYAAERRAANREVPDGIQKIIKNAKER